MATEIIWSDKFENYIHIDQAGDFVSIATIDEIEAEYFDEDNWDDYGTGTHDD